MDTDENVLEAFRGEHVARVVWEFIEKSKSLEVMPWVCDPQAAHHDALAVAEHNGWKRAIAEIRQLIMDTSNRLLAAELDEAEI